MPLLTSYIPELDSMKSYPQKIFFEGNTELLHKRKISIIGTRKPSKYTREVLFELSSKLSNAGVCIVSGGAMGCDAIAHQGAKNNTIAVLPNGINIKYPKINTNLLQNIQDNALLLSQFEEGFKARPWSFVVRNELVVALGEVLVVAEADLNSGSMRSVEFAKAMKKEIFVLPHRLKESLATQKLLQNNEAKAIYDIDAFVEKFAPQVSQKTQDPFLNYCSSNPTYEEALAKFPSEVFEAELNGSIVIKNGKVFLAL